MTFTFKATDVRANNVKLLRCVAKTLLRPGSHPNSEDNLMHFSNNCSCCTMHSNKVLKSLQMLRFWQRSIRCYGNTCVSMRYRNRPFLLYQET